MKGYEFDAFFSYKRDEQSDSWHEEVSKKIAFWLKQELSGREVKIFFDREDIHAGDKWERRIATGLKRSCCLIAIWSPDYFRSRWCVSEWKTFVARESKVGKELVVPASYYDGETFPAAAKAVQFKDFSEYASTMAFFWNTEDAYVFEKEQLKAFAKDVAAKIRDAPEFDEAFPIVIADSADLVTPKPIQRIADD